MAPQTNIKPVPSVAARRARGILLGLAALTVAVAAISLMLGRYPINPGEAVAMLVNQVLPLDQTWTDQQATLFFHVRLPRILLALMVGCCLAVAAPLTRAPSKTRWCPPTSWAPAKEPPSVPP